MVAGRTPSWAPRPRRSGGRRPRASPRPRRGGGTGGGLGGSLRAARLLAMRYAPPEFNRRRLWRRHLPRIGGAGGAAGAEIRSAAPGVRGSAAPIDRAEAAPGGLRRSGAHLRPGPLAHLRPHSFRVRGRRPRTGGPGAARGRRPREAGPGTLHVGTGSRWRSLRRYQAANVAASPRDCPGFR